MPRAPGGVPLVGRAGALRPRRRRAWRTRSRWSAWPTRTSTAQHPLHRVRRPRPVAERIGRTSTSGSPTWWFHFPGHDQERFLAGSAATCCRCCGAASPPRSPDVAAPRRELGDSGVEVSSLRARVLADVGAHPARAGRVRARPRALARHRLPRGRPLQRRVRERADPVRGTRRSCSARRSARRAGRATR